MLHIICQSCFGDAVCHDVVAVTVCVCVLVYMVTYGHVCSARHNRHRDWLSQMIEDATGHPAPVEQNYDATDDNCWPDIVFQNWCGEAQWVDVAIVSPYARAQGNPQNARPGSAVSVMDCIKRRKYATWLLSPLSAVTLDGLARPLLHCFAVYLAIKIHSIDPVL